MRMKGMKQATPEEQMKFDAGPQAEFGVEVIVRARIVHRDNGPTPDDILRSLQHLKPDDMLRCLREKVIKSIVVLSN